MDEKYITVVYKVNGDFHDFDPWKNPPNNFECVAMSHDNEMSRLCLIEAHVEEYGNLDTVDIEVFMNSDIGGIKNLDEFDERYA